MSSRLLPLGCKPVRDERDRPIGRVAGSEMDPVTRDPRWLLVELLPEAARRVNERGRFCWLPYDAVCSIRRDAIQLADRLPGLLGVRDPSRSRPG